MKLPEIGLPAVLQNELAAAVEEDRIWRSQGRKDWESPTSERRFPTAHLKTLVKPPDGSRIGVAMQEKNPVYQRVGRFLASRINEIAQLPRGSEVYVVGRAKRHYPIIRPCYLDPRPTAEKCVKDYEIRNVWEIEFPREIVPKSVGSPYVGIGNLLTADDLKV